MINNAGVFIAKPFTQYTVDDYANGSESRNEIARLPPVPGLYGDSSVHCRLTAETSAQRHISARCLCPWIRR